MLDYDNSAFYYFMLTILGFYLAPSILYILYRVVGAVLSSATKSKKLNELVRSDAEKEKAKEIVEKILDSRLFGQLGLLSILFLHCWA